MNTLQNTRSDLARISKSKKLVDVSPNCIRELAKRGLPLYKMGKAVFFSITEFEAFIRSGSNREQPSSVRTRANRSPVGAAT
jgi:hypothetical protein